MWVPATILDSAVLDQPLPISLSLNDLRFRKEVTYPKLQIPNTLHHAPSQQLPLMTYSFPLHFNVFLSLLCFWWFPHFFITGKAKYSTKLLYSPL